jgi:hypothetical protein
MVLSCGLGDPFGQVEEMRNRASCLCWRIESGRYIYTLYTLLVYIYLVIGCQKFGVKSGDLLVWNVEAAGQ